MRILLSAAGTPASVSIVRHLQSLGHAVIGIDASEVAEGLARGFCDEFHRAPLATSPEYLDFLCARLAEADLFMPFIDEELSAIAAGWAAIPAELSGRIAMCAPDVTLDCVDKRRFQDACTASGLPVAPEADCAPAFFKPRLGRGGKGVVEATDARLFEALRGRDGVLQRAIRGVEYTVDALFDRGGALVGCSPRRRLRAAGVSTAGIVEPDARLESLARRLGARWRFRYAVNFQAVRDGDGRDWIIELNPRLAGSAIFSAMAGCDPFAATIALWRGEAWTGAPRRLAVWRYWQERAEA